MRKLSSKKLSPGKMIPMLNVADIDKSIAFYELALGFQLVSSEQDLNAFRWGIIANDSIEFMLSESKGETPQQAVNPLNQSSWLVNFYFYPQDLSGLHQHLTVLDLKPTDITQTPYGLQEFSLQDPDGHLFSFGAE